MDGTLYGVDKDLCYNNNNDSGNVRRLYAFSILADHPGSVLGRNDMASFIRRLFGGGSKPKPAPVPAAPAPAPKAPAAPAAKAEDTGGTPAQPQGKTQSGSTKQKKRTGRTVYTETLGLSAAQRSGTNLKTLTGQ